MNIHDVMLEHDKILSAVRRVIQARTTIISIEYDNQCKCFNVVLSSSDAIANDYEWSMCVTQKDIDNELEITKLSKSLESS